MTEVDNPLILSLILIGLILMALAGALAHADIGHGVPKYTYIVAASCFVVALVLIFKGAPLVDPVRR